MGWKPRFLSLLGLLALLALLATVPVASAAEPGQTQWQLASFTWVKRVPIEPGAAANAHPAELTGEAIAAALGPVLVSVDGQAIPLFAKDELVGLTKALREALSLARPGEDLILLSSHRRGGGFMDPSQGLTARLFVREGALNLIVHDARLDFMDRYSADRTLPTFAYGSRNAPSGLTLQSPGATRLRGDWLALPLVAPAPVVAVAPSATTPALTVTKAASEAPAVPRDAAFYEAQAQRLKALKRLRDEHLISEAEYQEKRDAIVKTL
jgi:hypothetical protein